MSRNKENNPLPSTTRANGSVFSLAKTPPSEDFFTDSLLDASRIPSPSPQKALYGKPRRAIGTTRALQLARGSVNSTHRSSPSQKDESLPHQTSPTPPTLKKPDNSISLGDQSFMTPPPSSHGIEAASPLSDLSSPPRGLTDVYQRIADEEDLAATEGELDDEDDEDEKSEDIGIHHQDNIDRASANDRNGTVSRNSRGSRGGTPIQNCPYDNKENVAGETTDNLTQASGLSFLEQMTDQSLAAKLTPHTIDHAKNRQRLSQSQRISSGPISFKLGPPPSNTFQNQDWTSRSDESAKPAKKTAFKHAGMQSDFGFGKPKSDTTRRPSPPKVKAFSLAQRQVQKPTTQHPKDDDSDTSDELRDLERKFALSRIARLIQKPNPVPSQDSVPTRNTPPKYFPSEDVKALSSASETRSHFDEHPAQPHQVRIDQATDRDMIEERSNWTQSQSSSRKPSASQPKQINGWKRQAHQPQSELEEGSSKVDWAAAAADVPLPSIENSLTPQGTPLKNDSPGLVAGQRSIDKLRRWENDFTGMSFQVSESPPVRVHSKISDQNREREIARLAKQAVTTNRLEEIREKTPSEIQRKTSTSASAVNDKHVEMLDDQDTEDSLHGVHGEQIPETPVVVYRSSSRNSDRFSGKETTSRPQHDRQSSHEYLQRLARATSTTPRSSPAPMMTSDEITEELGHDQAKEYEEHTTNTDRRVEEPQAESKFSSKAPVAATPKVTGAWTDTILPDTIKTARVVEKQSKYAQTPHVSAGGWVDTPKPNGYRQSSAMAPMTIEEETEEIMTDIGSPVKKNSEKEVPSPEKETYIPQKPVPRSALSNILDQQRQRLISQDITTARDDTLNLGDATIASLEDLVTLDETEMTTLMRMELDQDDPTHIIEDGLDQKAAEAQLLERLGIKLERLRTNIHVAKKGISKLEHQVSHPAAELAPTPQTAVEKLQDGSCIVCGENGRNHSHENGSVFPLVYSTFTLPIPLLFRPQKPSEQRRLSLRQPTVLGWITILLWTWYLLESIMCELFSHPTHAERYTWPTRPEPEFPYVLPTMLLRWIGLEFWSFSILTPLWRVLVAVGRVFGMAFGWTDGFVDDPGFRGFFSEATKTAIRTASSVASTIAETDLSMMSDEIL